MQNQAVTGQLEGEVYVALLFDGRYSVRHFRV